MPRLSVCPQRHVWTSAADGDAPAQTACPVCGLEGRPAAVVLTSTGKGVETLPPTLVPPVVDDVTLVQVQSPAPVESDDPQVPSVPGYEIIRELGRGGMGVVYLARDRRLKRLVALKMVLAGAHADPETRLRFRREAEAIARLQHPGIVQIHDVGEHHGRPFLSLEYVEGSNLAYQMAWGAVAPRTTATLIEKLARIIHHAHERGIVHRDLTPRNVLLAECDSAQGLAFQPAGPWFEPKITDFGLAKELDTDLGQTQTGAIVGTPAYMAPEQAQGRPRDIGVATDVYALGAMLYELLTGRPPFMGETGHDTLRQIVEDDPAPPTRLQNRVPRDLETIALVCLEKDPRKRFQSASQLADDLHRYLTSEPIHARPASRRERAAKWARRHPTATALLFVVAASLVALVTGGVIYNAQLRRERDRAENNLELAMRAVDEMLTEVGEVQLATEPRMEEKRRALLTKALALHREFMKERQGDSRVHYSTAQAHRRLADVLRLLEQRDEAIAGYDRALALLNQLRADAPDDPDYRQQVAHCRNYQGEVHRAAGRHREAEAAYREAVQIDGTLARDFPDSPDHRMNLARARYSLGIVLKETNRLAEAEPEFVRSTDLLHRLTKEFPDKPIYQQHLARAYLNLGTAIQSPERFEEAQAAYDRARGLQQPLTDKYPDEPHYRHELAVTLKDSGNLLLREKRLEEANKSYGKAQELLTVLAADYPKVLVYRQELASTLNSLGRVHFDEASFEAAAGPWQDAAKLLEALLTERPDTPTYQGDLGTVLGNLGLAKIALGRHAEARTHLEQAVDRLKAALAKSGSHYTYQEALRDAYQNLAETLITLGDHTAAAAAARGLAVAPSSTALHRYYSACFLARCVPLAEGDTELSPEKGRELAKSYADESVAALREALDKGFNDVKRISADQGTIFEAVAPRADFQALVAQLSDKVTSASR
jgi:tetratricopeptide (TPR) repeat protein